MHHSITARKQPLTGGGWAQFVPSWPLLVGLLVFARLLSARLALLNDPDTYLHIAVGRWILAHAALPVHDPFSHTMPGAPWISGEWLAEVALAAVYQHAGWGGLIVVTGASAAAAVGLLTHFLLRRLSPLPALIAAIASFAVLEPHLLARPHLLALPLLVLWAGLLLAACDDGRPPPFLALPLMLLWANLHASFLFGLGLAAFLGVEAVLQAGAGARRPEIRRWAVFVAAALAAALVTPHGLATLVEPLRLMHMPALQASFVEWLSPDFRRAPALEMWLLGALFVGFATGARLLLTRLLLLLALVHETLQHVRHADLLAVVGPLATAAAVGRSLDALAAAAPPSRLTQWFARLARASRPAAVALSLGLAAALAAPTAWDPVVRGDDAVTPATALAVARRLGLSGPVLNSENFGGYLAFRGVPTFIDGRVEMYGNDFLAEFVAAERGDKAALRRLLARYRIEWTLLTPHSGAVAAIDALPGWERVYADAHAVIHRRIAAAPP
ncbi:MAG: hypothetical protein ACM3JG_08975 [Thiohalocapsa sp.]